MSLPMEHQCRAFQVLPNAWYTNNARVLHHLQTWWSWSCVESVVKMRGRCCLWSWARIASELKTVIGASISWLWNDDNSRMQPCPGTDCIFKNHQLWSESLICTFLPNLTSHAQMLFMEVKKLNVQFFAVSKSSIGRTLFHIYILAFISSRFFLTLMNSYICTYCHILEGVVIL